MKMVTVQYTVSQLHVCHCNYNQYRRWNASINAHLGILLINRLSFWKKIIVKSNSLEYMRLVTTSTYSLILVTAGKELIKYMITIF